jgi:hypothetical protein
MISLEGKVLLHNALHSRRGGPSTCAVKSVFLLDVDLTYPFLLANDLDLIA